MLFAYKKVFPALFAVSMLLAFAQPEKAQASSPTGQNEVQTTICAGSIIPLTGISEVMPKVSLASYMLNSQIVNDMRATKIVFEKKNKASYASAKVVDAKIPVSSESAVVEMVRVEVKSEAIEPEITELNAEVLLGLINDHRVKIGLSPLQKDESLMQIARERTSELFDEIFVNGNMHAGFYARNLPYYATENIIYNRSEAGAFNWWLNSSIHRSAIQNSEHTHTGIGCSGRTCSQIFTHFQPK